MDIRKQQQDRSIGNPQAFPSLENKQIEMSFKVESRNGPKIVDGELGEGIVGGTVSGSALDLITKITVISDNPEIVSAYSFGCVAPYMRFDKVQISGPS